jgi:hypothetical protein
MRRAYVVLGLVDEKLDRVYAVCHDMRRADELCYEAEENDPETEYTYYEVIEEDD